MLNITGSCKYSIAGIGCALGLIISSFVFANEATSFTNAAPAAVTHSADANSAMPDLSAPAPAANSSKAIVAPKKISGASQLANLMGGLALIITLIFGLSWFVKRFAQGGFMQNPSMKVVSSMPLGTRERLMLVDVGGKQLLLGVTATQINTLHVFDEPVVVQTEKNQPVTSEFSQKLMAILQQKNFTPADDIAHKKSNS
jgi:flagellar protein FliO/FliZ